SQLERELEKELDEMPPVQDLDEDEDEDDIDDDDDDDDDDDEAFDLMEVPGQPKTEQVLGDSSDEEQDKQKKQQEEMKQKKKQEHREALLQRLRLGQSPVAAGGGGGGQDLTTIEIMSSDDDEDSESDQDQPKAGDSSNDEEEVGVIEDSDSEDLKGEDYTTSEPSDSDDESPEIEWERNFDELLAQPQKQFAQLLKLSEIAFKLNDLAKIELAVQLLQNEATVPAHIWLKYLKARKVVTQTDDELKEFEEKCATALSYHYSTPLAEFVVVHLESQQMSHHHQLLWAKLLADYDVERPDYGLRLRDILTSNNDEFQELLLKHCATWKATVQERETINHVVSDFKHHLEDMRIQYSDWDWAKVHSRHVEEVLALDLPENIKYAIIRFIFERSVSKFPTADALWLAYMRFIQDGNEGEADEEDVEDDRLGRGYLLSKVLDLAKRGVRCRPSVRLNHKLLVLMERADFAQSAVDEQIQKILKRIEPDISMTVELHLDYLAYRVRNTNPSDEDQKSSLRAAFLKVWEDLSALYGEQADTRYEILQLWAQVEYAHLASPIHANTIWRQIMGYPGSNRRSVLWLAYAQMESEYNAGQGTRDILREALAQPCLEDGLMVQELYRRYERCYGSYETIAACQALELPPEYVRKPTRQQRPQQPQQQQQATRQQRSQQPQQKTQPKTQPKTQQKTPPEAQPPLNREQRRRQAHELRMGTKKQELPKAGVASKPSEEPIAKPSPVEPAATEVRDSHLKYSPHLETNKVFVRNLHPAVTKEELMELFQPFGQVKDVRLVHKQKQMKGIAYVEYEKPEAAQKAVFTLNGHKLHGLAIFVAISNPPAKPAAPGAPEPLGPGSADGGAAKVAPKRRVQTSLIPTTLVRQEAAATAAKKRRLELAQEENEKEEPQPSTSTSTSSSSNGKKEETSLKSNDD
ncbi:hypothetical protein KR059_009102, partial [Drosophila kikkawai]